MSAATAATAARTASAASATNRAVTAKEKTSAIHHATTWVNAGGSHCHYYNINIMIQHSAMTVKP